MARTTSVRDGHSNRVETLTKDGGRMDTMDATNARKAINRLVDAFADKHANSRGYMSQREMETEHDLETIKRFLDTLVD